MEKIKIEGFSFSYPNNERYALNEITLSIYAGEFITVCGKSGSGKSTFLRSLKPAIAPFGEKKGKIFIDNKEIQTLSQREECEKMGFVFQNPENQLVTDKVWHELAFGLESLGVKQSEIRAKVAEMATFFGIGEWFNKKTDELSGGQKQILNLASVMVMQPEVLILDEPTSQLDPISAGEFLRILSKINRELGTTVILSEHRLEDAFPISDRVLVMDEGRIIADGSPKAVCGILTDTKSPICEAIPSAARVYGALCDGTEFPISVAEGRRWLLEYTNGKNLLSVVGRSTDKQPGDTFAVEFREVYFRYEKEQEDVISGMNLKIRKGELYCLLGENGTGKSTALLLMSGHTEPIRGKVISDYNTCAMLPQNPEFLFSEKTVMDDLLEMFSGKNISIQEKEKEIYKVAELCNIEPLFSRHPYDLSGGEKQRAALAKVLLMSPELILLDEPTKGMDSHFKREFAEILNNLKKSGVTIVMVSHDIEFCAEYADRCGLMFDGKIVSEGNALEFFADKSFYTTAANRMARNIIPNAVLVDDIVKACGGEPEEIIKTEKETVYPKTLIHKEIEKTVTKKFSPVRIILGLISLMAFAAVYIFGEKKFSGAGLNLVYCLEFLILAVGIGLLLPQKKQKENVISEQKKKGLSRHTLISLGIVLIVVPLSILFGVYFLNDKKYYFISTMIMIETFVPFLCTLESGKKRVRELIVISIMCAVAVSGRSLFSMLPQFKPALAVVIISGIALGGETGFLVGALYAFVSNFFFGQGPWTPWQMLASGLVGFAAGFVFNNISLHKNRIFISIFGVISVVLIYGGILNPASVIMFQPEPTAEMIYSSYVLGFPFDLMNGISTAFFLWIASGALLEKLGRIKKKYGVFNR